MAGKEQERSGSRDRAAPVVGGLGFVLALLVAYVLGQQPAGGSDGRHRSIRAALAALPADRLHDADLRPLGMVVSQLWAGETIQPAALPPRLKTKTSGLYVALRQDGRWLAESWQPAVGEAPVPVIDALTQALSVARAATDGHPDQVEIFLSRPQDRFELVDQAPAYLTEDIYQGIWGFELASGTRQIRVSPTRLIAQNRSPIDQIGEILERWQLPSAASSQALRVRRLGGDQVLVSLGRDLPQAVRMVRGNVELPVARVTQDSTRALAERLAGWLLRNLSPSGQIDCRYQPSLGETLAPQANDALYQWMAAVALGRWAAVRDDAAIWQRTTESIDGNLTRFYRSQRDFGLLEVDGTIDLGSLAIASLAILEHPDSNRWAGEAWALRHTIDSLWRPNGRFKTFFRRKATSREEYYYPGEAMLLWASYLGQSPDPKLFSRFRHSLDYYRSWFAKDEERHPAFIPRHTQAAYQLWTQTQDEGARDFVFEMNDWLVERQQLKALPQHDAWGRFDSGDEAHVGATGAYLEGLVDAYRLAESLGERRRARAYRRAIVWGLRSLMQRQFVDEVDMFYVHDPTRVVGALRTTVYDNTIRCEDVQHSLMAAVEVLEAFTIDDYHLD